MDMIEPQIINLNKKNVTDYCVNLFDFSQLNSLPNDDEPKQAKGSSKNQNLKNYPSVQFFNKDRVIISATPDSDEIILKDLYDYVTGHKDDCSYSEYSSEDLSTNGSSGDHSMIDEEDLESLFIIRKHEQDSSEKASHWKPTLY